MPTLDEIVENNAFILFGESATNIQKEILRNACLAYAHSIVPEGWKPRTENNDRAARYNDCRTEILNKISEDEKNV